MKTSSSVQTKEPRVASPTSASPPSASSPAPGQPFARGPDLSGTARGPVAPGLSRPQRRRSGAAVAERSPASLRHRNPPARPGPAAAGVSAGAAGAAE